MDCNDTKTFNVLKAGSFIEIEYDNLTTYGIPFRLDYDVENETLLNIRIYDSKGNIVYDKNFDEISELPDDMSNLTEEAYLGYYFFIHINFNLGGGFCNFKTAVNHISDYIGII